MTITEAKSFLRENWSKGATCPCCQQHVQLYRRPITSAMAAGLILMYHFRKNAFTHVEDFFKKIKCPSSIRGDFSKLRYWGLIEENTEEEGQEGFYRVTAKGREFVRCEIKVESHIQLYNDKFYGFVGNYVDIRDCLKTKFDYEKLMAGML